MVVHLRDNLGAQHVQATTAVNARRLFASLDFHYTAVENEYEVIDILIRLGQMEPSLWSGSMRPIRLGQAPAEPQRSASTATTTIDARLHTIKIKDLLSIQLSQQEPAKTKYWPKSQSIQMWNLNCLLVFSGHGELQVLVIPILRHGSLDLLNSIKVNMIGRITDRFPRFSEAYSRPHNEQLVERTIRTHTNLIDMLLPRDDKALTVDREKQVHEAFLEAFRQLLLVFRAIPYAESDADQMGRLEIKRLCQLQRPPGLTDPQFWSEIVTRFRNWRKLLGPLILKVIGSELRDFLPNISAFITDRHTSNLLVMLANEWAIGLRDVYKLPSVFDLLGHDMRLISRPAYYPASPTSGVGPSSVAVSGNLFEKIDSLRKVYDIGQFLQDKGYDTSGSDMVYYFVEFTATRLGENNLGSSIMGNDASQMLPGDTMGYEEEASHHVLGNNDILYVSSPWPEVRRDRRHDYSQLYLTTSSMTPPPTA